MRKYYVPLSKLRRRHFPITLRRPGLFFTLGNITMLAQHLLFLEQIGCTPDTRIEVTVRHRKRATPKPL